MTPRVFTPVLNPRNAQAAPGSVFTPAIDAWSSPGALGALSLASMPKWAGYAVAGAALYAAYKKMVPLWAGLVGAGAAYWFLIRPGGSAGATVVTAGTVTLADGTQYQLTQASPGTLSADGQSITVAGTTYPVLSALQSVIGNGVDYVVDTPVASTG
jgi:hypothetical protein